MFYLAMAATRQLMSRTSIGGKTFEHTVVVQAIFTVQLELRRYQMSCQPNDTDTPIIPLSESQRFMTDCLQAVGAPKEHAVLQGILLAAADYRGHYSHGMNRIEMYVNDIKAGTCDSKATPQILKEMPATAWVDGKNSLGAVVGNFCMALAMKKAKEVGVGWVAAKGSNHYGIAGLYALQAIDQGLLGMSFTNTSPFLCPTRSKDAALGTNPIALGAPAKDGDSFVLDMATTAVALGKIEIQKRKHKPLPKGWAQDEKGQITTDAELGYKSGRLMPLGGSELNSGYKGYGLATLVEIFCGILAGANYGPNIRKWGTFGMEANLGQSFVAINPDCFATGFRDRMSDMLKILRNLPPVDPNLPVMAAGDPERAHMALVDKVGGVRYVPDQMSTCERLAKTLNIKPLQPVS